MLHLKFDPLIVSLVFRKMLFIGIPFFCLFAHNAQGQQIHGIIRDKQTHLPIAGAVVLSLKKNTSIGTSDPNGLFSFPEAVSVNKEGKEGIYGMEQSNETVRSAFTHGKILLQKEFHDGHDAGRIGFFDISGRLLSSLDKVSSMDNADLIKDQADANATNALPLKKQAASRSVIDTLQIVKEGYITLYYPLEGDSLSNLVIYLESTPVTNADFIEQKMAFHVFYVSDSSEGYVSVERLKAQVAQLNKAFHAEEPGSKLARIPLPIRFTLHDTDIQYINVSDPKRLKQLKLDHTKLSEGLNKPTIFFYGMPVRSVLYMITNALNKNPKKYINVYVGRDNGFGHSPLAHWYPEESHRNAITLSHQVVSGSDWKEGVYSQGDILVHEIGHYYGLLHIYEGGCAVANDPLWEYSDLVGDTPRMSDANTSLGYKGFFSDKKFIAKLGCTLPNGKKTVAPIHNYMLNSPDGGRYEFTPGQTDRMMEQMFQYKAILMSHGKWNTYAEWKAEAHPLTVPNLAMEE